MSGWTETGRLDLSRDPGQADPARLAALRARVADLAGVDDRRVALAGDAGAARAALGAAPQVAAFPPSCGHGEVGPALYRLPPAEARLWAVIAEEAATLRDALEPGLAPLCIAASLDALTPAGLAEAEAARDAIAGALAPALAALVENAEIAGARLDGRELIIDAADAEAFERCLARAGLRLERDGARFVGHAASVAAARQIALALGARSAARTAARRRTTNETDILVAVDLDGSGSQIDTGIAFYDHMLEQVAAHGGFALRVAASGDLAVDAHHTIEDVAIALGEALAEALGDKKGVARYGFTAPMDESLATVAIDLSGRPLARFEGNFVRDEIGGFPTEMTRHVFRSLSDAMKAAVHVRVEGEDDHHKIEACFKGFGRALRQATRVEGGGTPSTKGAL